MRKTLEELWSGNVTLQSRAFKRGTHYEDTLKKMCKNEERLTSMMEDKEKELFEKFCCCREELARYSEEDIFVTGFRLGARIIIETFCEDDGLFGKIDV